MRLGSMEAKMEGIGPGLSAATGVLVEIRDHVKASNDWLQKMNEKMDKVIRDGLKMK
jgi:hypothetical protein